MYDVVLEARPTDRERKYDGSGDVIFSMFKGPSGVHRRFDLPLIKQPVRNSNCILLRTPRSQNILRKFIDEAETIKLDWFFLDSLSSSDYGLAFECLKRLQVDGGSLKYLVSVEEGKIPKAVFTSLEVLELSSLDDMKEIFHGPMPETSSLEKLKRIQLRGCRKIVSLFSMVVWLKLKHLEELHVEDSPSLNEVFPLQETGSVPGEIEENATIILVPQLRSLVLKDLEILTTIWRGNYSSSLRNLKSMEVNKCHSLKHLFTPAMVIALQQLETLVICECPNLVTAVASEDEFRDVTSTAVAVLPQLRKLHLINLENLSSFNQQVNKSLLFGWPSLVNLNVLHCNNLERLPLSTGMPIPPQLKKIRGNSQEMFERLLEAEDEDMKSKLRPLFKVFDPKEKDDQ